MRPGMLWHPAPFPNHDACRIHTHKCSQAHLWAHCACRKGDRAAHDCPVCGEHAGKKYKGAV